MPSKGVFKVLKPGVEQALAEELPGDGLAVLATGPSPVTRSELEEALAAGEGAGLLGNISFELR